MAGVDEATQEPSRSGGSNLAGRCTPWTVYSPGLDCPLPQMVIVGRSTRELCSPCTWLSPMLRPPGPPGPGGGRCASLLPSAPPPPEFLLILPFRCPSQSWLTLECEGLLWGRPPCRVSEMFDLLVALEAPGCVPGVLVGWGWMEGSGPGPSTSFWR